MLNSSDNTIGCQYMDHADLSNSPRPLAKLEPGLPLAGTKLHARPRPHQPDNVEDSNRQDDRTFLLVLAYRL